MKYWSASARAAENWVEVPRGYRKVHAWTPQIGDIFPNFNVPSTQGSIAFHNWAEGEWVYLFSHPSAFTPICTTELVRRKPPAGWRMSRTRSVSMWIFP